MLKGLLRAMRPHQWVKNLFVVAPLVFAKGLLDTAMVSRVALAAGLFSLAASTIYLINDLADIESDRKHPLKRFRPIPSGEVPLPLARGAVAVLGVFALVGGTLLDPRVAACIIGYLVLNLAYTFKLKRVAYVDVLCIATGFELRVLTGTFAADAPPTLYLLAVTFLLASFLGLGKRMHELRQGERAHRQRAVLERYNRKSLTRLLLLTGTLTVGVYLIYTLDPRTAAFFGTPYLSLTAPFTFFGVMRFLFLVSNRPNSESPTEEMLRDVPFLLNLALWALTVVAVIYAGQA